MVTKRLVLDIPLLWCPYGLTLGDHITTLKTRLEIPPQDKGLPGTVSKYYAMGAYCHSTALDPGLLS